MKRILLCVAVMLVILSTLGCGPAKNIKEEPEKHEVLNYSNKTGGVLLNFQAPAWKTL